MSGALISDPQLVELRTSHCWVVDDDDTDGRGNESTETISSGRTTRGRFGDELRDLPPSRKICFARLRDEFRSFSMLAFGFRKEWLLVGAGLTPRDIAGVCGRLAVWSRSFVWITCFRFSSSSMNRALVTWVDVLSLREWWALTASLQFDGPLTMLVSLSEASSLIVSCRSTTELGGRCESWVRTLCRLASSGPPRDSRSQRLDRVEPASKRSRSSAPVWLDEVEKVD